MVLPFIINHAIRKNKPRQSSRSSVSDSVCQRKPGNGEILPTVSPSCHLSLNDQSRNSSRVCRPTGTSFTKRLSSHGSKKFLLRLVRTSHRISPMLSWTNSRRYVLFQSHSLFSTHALLRSWRTIDDRVRKIRRSRRELRATKPRLRNAQLVDVSDLNY